MMYSNPFDIGPSTLFGMRVIEAPMRPKMQLAPGDYVTPEFRKEIDAWLIEFFGMESVVPKNTAFMFGNNIIMRPESVVMLTNIGA